MEAVTFKCMLFFKLKKILPMSVNNTAPFYLTINQVEFINSAMCSILWRP